MLDRVLMLIVTLTLLLFLAQAVLGVVFRVVVAVMTGASNIRHTGSFLGSVLAAVVAVCFVVGLLIRALRWLRESGVSGRRHRSGTSARQDWAGRGFADDVPTYLAERPATARRVKPNSRERD